MSPQTTNVSPSEIRSELGKVLKSKAFESSELMRDFLRHLVAKKLEGKSKEEFKEYTIGVEVFGLKGNWIKDTASTKVRVEAGRLRAKLREYYFEDGGCDPVRISLGKGSYVPSFDYSPSPPNVIPSLRDPARDFIGREAEIEELKMKARKGGVVIYGMGGVGKSELALKVGHDLKSEFPDGQISFDLEGISEHARTTAEAMADVIRAFIGPGETSALRGSGSERHMHSTTETVPAPCSSLLARTCYCAASRESISTCSRLPTPTSCCSKSVTASRVRLKKSLSGIQCRL
jgi:hypothetical protein